MKSEFNFEKPADQSPLNSSPVDPSSSDSDLNPTIEFEPDAIQPDSHFHGETVAKQRTSPQRILIVDDDAMIRDLLAKMLTRSGYQTECADDGEQAWTAICSESYDLLITDHEMPNLRGLDLLRRIRRHGEKIPVIFISGAMPWDAPDLMELMQPGATLVKPFSFQMLLAKVRRFLNPPLQKYDEEPFESPAFPPSSLESWRAIIAKAR